MANPSSGGAPEKFQPSLPLLLSWNWRKVALSFFLLGLIAVAGRQGWHSFRNWQRQHLVRQAGDFLAKTNYRAAMLSVRQALRLDDNDVNACRIIAVIAEKSGSPEAVFWRGRIAELEPATENYLTWASAGLRFGEPVIADQALARIDSAGRQTARFHQIAAALALASKLVPLAEFHFAQALRLEPTNQLAQLNLAVVRLQSTNRELAGAGRQELQRLRAIPELRDSAVRALLADAQRTADYPAALNLAKELIDRPQSEIRDHLAYLEILHVTRSAEFNAHLESLQTQASVRPEYLFPLMSWMNARGLARSVLELSSRLPSELGTSLPVPLALAESRLLLSEWSELKTYVAGGNWREFDFLRHAYHARALRELDQRIESLSELRAAVNLISDNAQKLAVLARIIHQWGWQADAEQIWWKVGESQAPRSDRRAAYKALFRLYRSTDATRQLCRVSERILALDREDRIAKNNLAQLGLLLNPKTELAHQLAAENYRDFPKETAFAATYAHSLHCQGRTAEALQVLEPLGEELLEQPALAAYYGILLAAHQRREQALPYLELADKSGELLPEEHELVKQALVAPRSN